MLSDKLLEQIFTHDKMQKMPIEIQTIFVRVFNEVLENRLEENPYATISELFVSATDKSVSE